MPDEPTPWTVGSNADNLMQARKYSGDVYIESDEDSNNDACTQRDTQSPNASALNIEKRNLKIKVDLPENKPRETATNVFSMPPFAFKNRKVLLGQEVCMGNYSPEAQRVLLSGKGFYQRKSISNLAFQDSSVAPTATSPQNKD